MAGYSPNTKNPKRITDLDPFESTAIETDLYPTSKASKWHLAIDYKDYAADVSTTSAETTDPVDYGTKRIPVSRVVLRDENGLIPPSMLPEYVDDVVYGKFVPKSSGGTYAEFQTVEPIVHGPDDPDPEPDVYKFKYRYPCPEETQTIKDASKYPHIIWMDTFGSGDPESPDYHQYHNIQFIFHTPEQPYDSFCGFTPLPSTKVIKSNYGIIVDNQALTTDIAVKKPDKRTANISGTYTGSASCQPVILSELTPGVTYMMNANMSLHPDSTTLTAMIEDFTIVVKDSNNNILTSVTCDVNMADSVSQYVSKSALITVPANTTSVSISANLPTLPSGKKVVVDVSSSIELTEVL